MEQYIPKSALVAEIERLEKINQEYKKTWKWKFKWFYRTIIGRLEVLEGLKNFINTLEVKEVQESTAADRGTAEEIIINLKRIEKDYRIDLTREIEWLRNKVKKGE